MILWSVIVLLIGAACGLVNGLLVGIGRLQPILVTLATLSIYQGLRSASCRSRAARCRTGYTAVLTNTNAPWALIYVVALGVRLERIPANALRRRDLRDRQ